LLYVQYVKYVTSYNLQWRKSKIKRPSHDALNITLHLRRPRGCPRQVSYPVRSRGRMRFAQNYYVFSHNLFSSLVHYSTEWCLINLIFLVAKPISLTSELAHTHNSIKHTTSVVCHPGRVSKVTERFLYTLYILYSVAFCISFYYSLLSVVGDSAQVERTRMCIQYIHRRSVAHTLDAQIDL